MSAVEDGGEWCAKQQYKTRYVPQGEPRNARPPRAVTLIEMEVLKAPGEDVLCQLPQQSRQKSARQSVSQRNLGLRHEAIDQHKKHDSDQITACGKHHLPECTAN